MGFCAARAGELRAYARGLVDALRGARRALATRAALSREARARLQALQAHRPGLAGRALRHFRERLI
ncbi:MAG: hypothetical protein AUH29_11320 [Candidatus Rokubacteria bacterium 13_1_40CM_69_27]|nr:MAG: hypothetical protein AUH29_11320 [Candidatus Rokubacteria bacterium 13_1_40CM_69_27]OLC35423.1 MAG: hypothetical protein AUH81_10290 [Candidatus Rokubacteria bacterium 13_1_40CM_4_69_5]